jgi:ribose transport system ATP-binding protein
MKPNSGLPEADERPSSAAGDGGHASAVPATRAGGLAVVVRGLSKTYGGVVALRDMDLDVAAAEIHAVVGENGAGKSTLMKILAGVTRPDAGSILIDGTTAQFDSPAGARRAGVGIVFQELSLFPHRSVLANLFAGREPTRRGLVSVAEMRRQAAPLLERVGLDVDVDVSVGNLPIGERQLIELCRVLLERPRLLILDEPNSALNQRETERLFGVLRELARGGVSMLYVSHRLEEVFQIADRITVMRNGHEVVTRDRAALTMADVVRGMVGELAGEMFVARKVTGGTDEGDVLSVRGLSVGDELQAVTFDARAGEIVGLAGLEGSGVATLLGVLFGDRRSTAGAVRYPDGAGLPVSTTAAARRGISLVPAERRRQGLMLEASIARNVAHVSVGALPSRKVWLRRSELAAAAHRQIGSLHIRARSAFTPVDELSGGNQQKVVVGKWLEVAPRVVLLDDPTRGVDIAAKREIYGLIRRLAEDGRIVLFRSTELPELVGLADRVLVLYRGRLVGEIGGSAADSRGLLHAINTGELPEAA